MRILLPLALCASSLITGCASGMLATPSTGDDVDAARVAAINRVASSHGVDVHWVSYPQRRTVATAPAVAPAAPGADGSSLVLPVGT